MMENIWLSVLMPVRNGGEYLRFALESVVAQGTAETNNIEIICVDDNSTDQTPEVLDTYRNRLNMTILRNEPNMGWPASTNRAMALARGTYQCWLHHDDAWQPGRLFRLRQYVNRWPHAGLILQPTWFIDQNGRRVGQWRCPLPADQSLDPVFIVPRMLVQNFNAVSTPLYRSDMLRSVGCLDDHLWYTADWDFWLRLAEAGSTVYYPEPLTCYRIHPDSMTSRRAIDSHEMWRQFHPILDRYTTAGSHERQQVWKEVEPVALFSALTNIELARWAAGGGLHFWRIAVAFLRLGPRGWHHYCRDSRIHERAFSRMRIGLASRRTEGRQPTFVLGCNKVLDQQEKSQCRRNVPNESRLANSIEEPSQ